MLDREMAFDLVVLLLLLHLVAVVVALVLTDEAETKSTRLWRYVDPRISSATFVVVALLSWAVVASGSAPAYLAFASANALHLLVGWGLVSFGLSNARLSVRVLSARLREGPPADGDTVAVSGTATPVEGTVETPFGGVDALCSHATVEAYEEGGRDLTNWYEHDEEVESRRFAMDGPGGELVVAPAAAYWRVPQVFTRTYDADGPAPERVASGFDAHPDLDPPDSPTVAFSVEEHRVTERALRPGSEVLVVGEVSVEDGGPVVDGGEPFVLALGDPTVAYAGMAAWTVFGTGLGLWLLAAAFGPFVAFRGLL
jgi:hypothetical protein